MKRKSPGQRARRQRAVQKYNNSDKGRAARKRYSQTPKGLATTRQYQQSESGKAAAKRYRDDRRADLIHQTALEQQRVQDETPPSPRIREVSRTTIE